MNLLESFRIAIGGLLTNRLRSILTTLGIIIGVGSVIGLVSLGRGVENFIASEFQSLGSNVLFVFSSPPASDTRTEIQPISTLEGEALANPAIAPAIEQVAMETSLVGLLKRGANSSQIAVGGVTPNYTEVRSWAVQPGGAFISQDDVDSTARVSTLR